VFLKHIWTPSKPHRTRTNTALGVEGFITLVDYSYSSDSSAFNAKANVVNTTTDPPKYHCEHRRFTPHSSQQRPSDKSAINSNKVRCNWQWNLNAKKSEIRNLANSS
jgi:hypothetical protein